MELVCTDLTPIMMIINNNDLAPWAINNNK
jgi:hypothetical protein